MARRRHKKKSEKIDVQHAGRSIKRDPKSMVIRIGGGQVGPSVSQLVTDVRHIMEPGTAVRLKERRKNRLRDYMTMCGPLGVTHLMLFSRSQSGNTNMRLTVAPHGPTLNFKVERYTLAKDVQKSQRRPRGGGNEFLSPPLLVMNSFFSASKNTPNHLESLVATMFQSLFPPINPQVAHLRQIRRILLLNRELSEHGFVLNIRHYAITTKSTGMSRPLKRLNASSRSHGGKPLPNLSKMQDISEFITENNGEGYMTDATTASSGESEAEVEVVEQVHKLTSQKKSGRTEDRERVDKGHQETHVEKRAIKLVELGPRLRLRLAKVEEGLCDGKIMWHDYIHKTVAEVKELEQRWEKRKAEKAARVREQKENVARKKREREEKRGMGKNGGDCDDNEGEKAGNSDADEMDIDDIFEDYDNDDGARLADDGFDSEGLEGEGET